MTAALVVLHGVLRAPSGAAIADGVDLYRSLQASHDIVLLTDTDEEDARWWLKRERLTPLPPYLLHADTGSREQQLVACRDGLGLPVSLFVTANPLESAMALRLGVTSLCFAHPLFMREEFRPDHIGGRKPWAALAGEMEHQARLLDDVGPVV